MTEIQQIDINGVTITPGIEFELQRDSQQLADEVVNLSDEYTHEDVDEIVDELNGANLTVERITQEPDGTHLELTTPLTDEPISVMQFAIRKLMQNEDIAVTDIPSP